MAIWTSAYHSRSLPPILSIFPSPIPAHRRHRQHHPGVLSRTSVSLRATTGEPLHCVNISTVTEPTTWYRLVWLGMAAHSIDFHHLQCGKLNKQPQIQSLLTDIHIHTYVCCPAILPLVLIFGLSTSVGACVYVCVCVYCVFLAAFVETPPA